MNHGTPAQAFIDAISSRDSLRVHDGLDNLLVGNLVNPVPGYPTALVLVKRSSPDKGH